ncbi:TPA: restriction endonuclease subunit S [Campylobacter jejuni]|uniref:restriction endonuclease subunit S n=1 Tax=Campylobacter jejuni TaxID=197 RepID=UPI00069B2DC4|nr:restriction endonuclease subunit S [Campylobacter jejuni]ECL3617881.1 restriction endonuclease subunit S [Campylobacter jejuni]ECP9613118.1 restriction endonuclease subunit S [Campylobacter jejuni]ECQ5988762.1 restriction endonuclease subunit S [Campylobacter jejuni]ECQ6011307.1 restriction endonuclease subunit S [Campylobacter jejuni]ECR2140986.1 restriction endonuclease subunit S [Campylobacter jejuni]
MLNQTLQEKYPHLEISVLKLSEVQKDNESKRIDSEFFKKEYFDVMETMQLNQVEYLGDNMKFNSRYSQPKYDETSKIKVINSQYIRNEYIDYENAKSGYGKIVPKESVLINATGVGTLGRVFINILDFDFSIDSHINVIVVKNKTYLNPYFLAIFLQSYYGQIQIIRYYSGTSGQIEIYPRDFNYFKIPIFPMEFQLEIQNLVKDSHKALEESKELYKKAEETLYLELGLDPKNPLQSLLDSKTNNPTNSPNISIHTLKESFLKTGRLDSEYYQSKYEDIEKFIKSYPNGYDSFSSIINNKDTNFTPKNNENYSYIELANIGNNGNISEPISDLGKNLPTRARRIVSKGDVIISSIEGSLSSCALITQEFDKHLVSTGFFVLNSKLLNGETLLVMFKSQIFQEYLKKFPSGTILCAINKEELSKILIPKIDSTTQEKIAKYIQESFNLRKKSKQLLDNAKIKVEEQIQGKI